MLNLLLFFYITSNTVKFYGLYLFDVLIAYVDFGGVLIC
jgi:hypothetical protein